MSLCENVRLNSLWPVPATPRFPLRSPHHGSNAGQGAPQCVLPEQLEAGAVLGDPT